MAFCLSFRFREALAGLRREGRYRVFTDIVRARGAYPNADFHAQGAKRPVVVWCSNDYLGMGQHPEVLAAMHEAIDAAGAGSGGTRNISGTTHYHVELEAELASLHGKEAALLFTSGFVSNDTTLATLAKLLPGLIVFSDALNHASMIEGIRHGGMEKRVFKHNDMEDLEAPARGERSGAAQADRLRIRLFDGRRFRTRGRDLRSGEEICSPHLYRRSPRRGALRSVRRRASRRATRDGSHRHRRRHARQGVRRDGAATSRLRPS